MHPWLPESIGKEYQRLEQQGLKALGDPMRVYYVDTSALRFHLTQADLPPGRGWFRVISGDWPLKARPLRHTPIFQAYQSHFQKGVAWEEIPAVRRQLQHLEQGGWVTELDTTKERQDPAMYRDYLRYMDKLYEQISRHGYRAQQELSTREDFLDRTLEPALNEIQVAILPDGEFAVRTGIHRAVLALLSDTPQVPVRTRVRHTSWQEKRELLNASADDFQQRYPALMTHPELAEPLASGQCPG